MTGGQAESPLTMVIVNWRRPYNVPLIIDALKSQTVRPKIFLWNNHPRPICDKRAEWVINSSQNVHAYCLPFLFRRASTEFVGFQDDDLMPGHSRVIEQALDTLRALDDPQQMVGAFGVKLEPGVFYGARGGDVRNVSEDTPVDVVKNRFVLLRRAAVVTLPDTWENHHADLWQSFHLAGTRRRFHRVASCFRDALLELPEGDVGYSRQDGHLETRHKMTQAWLRSTEGAAA